MIPIKTESAWRGISDCRNCGIRDMVLFSDLNEHDFSQIHAPIDDLEFANGVVLYGEGSAVQGIFTLRSGMVKLVRSTLDGRPRIVRVLRSGDVVGLEALASGHYDSDAIALTPVSVCRIPLEVVQKLASNSPRLHTQLMSKWQRTLKDADDWLADLNFGTARQRVTNLVMKMRSPSDHDVSVLFSREDMGAMLDLKFETVSREMTRLVREGVIEQLDKQGRIYRVCLPNSIQSD
ncbi:MAG: Crp/Fnr family transcriptional regulator [Rhodoferax sp.]|uniref:Crp/Fnr family transcriptional regulator n=1 Tax=Rhodoferax sp. TaxID=50421 RepID=UPI0026392C6E|nr:Crp/Fnr family transcriptional regulator [Rhodoferax sp.]MDD2880254.1 Crp/Fnr family transcriptional regulator [Rhodoferax sp.]